MDGGDGVWDFGESASSCSAWAGDTGNGVELGDSRVGHGAEVSERIWRVVVSSSRFGWEQVVSVPSPEAMEPPNWGQGTPCGRLATGDSNYSEPAVSP